MLKLNGWNITMVDNLTDDPIEGGGTPAEPEMETITLDGEEVTVPKEYAEKLKRIESEMKSGLNRKHEAKVKEDAAKLKADKDWLNNHPSELWKDYEPTIDGGRGFIGREEMLDNKPTETKPTTEKNSEVPISRQEFDELKDEIRGVKTSTDKTNISQAAEARDTALSKHQFADREILTKQMEHYYLTHNYEHPSPRIIEEFAKTEHDRIAGIVNKKSTATTTTITDTTTLPKPSNTPPSGEKKKLPRLDDTDAIVKDMEGLNIHF